MDDDVFQYPGPYNLKTIKFTGNKLTDFPCFALYRPANATGSLEVRGGRNSISTIRLECAAGLIYSRKLKLWMHKNNLQSIQNLSLAMQNMNKFIIRHNPGLTDFPIPDVSFISGSKFEVLDGSDTGYIIFPMLHMRHTLQEVLLMGGALECVPPSRISGLISLEVLNLQGNALRLFPDPTCMNMTSDLPVLSEYDIGTTVYFPLLTELCLDKNNLIVSPNLAMTPNIVKLGLNFNSIQAVPWQFVEKATKLEILNISNNFLISFLPDVPLGVNVSITWISMTKMHLENNSLSTINESTFPVHADVFIFVHGNPLICDANMCWVKDGICMAHIYLDPMPCVLPVNLQDVPWANVSRNELGCSRGEIKLCNVKTTTSIQEIIIHNLWPQL